MNTSIMAAVLFSNLFLCNIARADKDIEYSAIGWWQIRYREVGNLTAGCYAVAQFQDRTRLMMALIQGDTKNWVLFIDNPEWSDWIEKQQEHKLLFRAAKLWYGLFSVIPNTQIINSGVTADFMKNLADADSLTIWNAEKQLLTSLNLKDSAAAIGAVVDCVRDHRPNGAPIPEAATTISGTAFFVAPHRLVTTNHVVKECRNPIQVRYPGGAPHAATISANDEANDLALLDTDMTNIAAVSFRLRPRLGEPAASYGFPYSGVLSSSGNFTLGNVTSLRGMNDDSRFIQISTPTQPGNSGGPLLDMSGNVVGVIVGQLDATTMMQIGKGAPQNVNFAIQASVVVDFLSVKGVDAKLAGSDVGAHRDLPPSDVADLAKKFTVQVYCQGASQKTSGTAGALVSALSDVADDKFIMAAAPRRIGKLNRRVTGNAARSLLCGNWHPLNGASPAGAH